MTFLDGLLIFICFVGSAFFSGVETGSYTINRIRLLYRLQINDAAAKMLDRVLKDPHIFVFSILIGQNITVYFLSKLVTDLFVLSGSFGDGDQRLFSVVPWNAEVAATLTLMFPLFLFGEVGPKNLFRRNADALMYPIATLLRFFVLVFYPVTFCLRQLFRFLTQGLDTISGHELKRLSADGLRECIAAEGLFTTEQSRMMDNATSMHRIQVRELMIPFKDLPVLPASAKVADFKKVSGEQDATELVLGEDAQSMGLISLYTLVRRGLKDDELLRPYVEDLILISETKNIKSAFYRLRRQPRHCAIVVDGRDNPVGLIRLEHIARYIAVN